MGIFTSIATAVLPSLIGGIFGSKKKETTTRTNFKQMRDDAVAAGYNPLTALMATGGAGNVTTTRPDLSTGQFISDALSRGLDTWSNQASLERDAEVEQLRIDTMREELDQLRKRGKAPTGSFGFDIPSVTGVGPTSTGTTQVMSPPRLATPGQVHELRPVIVKRDDGLTGANPDAPAEAETDLWSWGREGTFLENFDEVIRRNVTKTPLLTWGDKVLWDW